MLVIRATTPVWRGMVGKRPPILAGLPCSSHSLTNSVKHEGQANKLGPSPLKIVMQISPAPLQL
jgi:hypothetical protein